VAFGKDSVTGREEIVSLGNRIKYTELGRKEKKDFSSWISEEGHLRLEERT